MSLILGKKIKMNIVGAPTMSDKYDVISYTLSGNDVYKAGEIVNIDEVFNGKISKTITAGNRVGVISHQNFKAETGKVARQTFTAGDVVGIIFKGFCTTLAQKDATSVKVQEGIIDDAGVEVKNLIKTGAKETFNETLELVEVELI